MDKYYQLKRQQQMRSPRQFISLFLFRIFLYYYYTVMSDILNINIGQTGIRVADHFWKILSKEHSIDKKQQQGNMAFFQQKNKSWEARSLFIDTDERTINKLRSKKDEIYNDNDFICSNLESRGLYAEALYKTYPQMKDQITDKIRKKVERCDHFSGFLIFSTLNGGTSSGVGMGTIRSIRQQYSSKMIQTVKLFPNNNISNPLQIYNTAFSIKQQVQNTDIAMLFDNPSVLRVIAKQQYNKPTIDYQNKQIATSIAASTIPFRFSGSLNTSQRKMATNLVMFPRMHFFPFSLSNEFTVSPLATALKPDNLSLSNYYQEGGKVFNIYAGVHDHFASEQQIYRTIKSQSSKHQINYIQFLQDTVHMSIHSPTERPSASILVNSYNMKRYCNVISELFSASFRRRAFLCWYRGVGLDEFQFTEIESNINDLASEYTQYEPYDVEEDYSNQSQYAQ